MASLTTSGVTINRAWNEAGPAGRDLSCRRVTLVLVAMGTVANPIPASVLGLTVIEQSSGFIKSDNLIMVNSCPAVDGSKLLLNAPSAASDAPQDITGTFTGVVKGY